MRDSVWTKVLGALSDAVPLQIPPFFRTPSSFLEILPLCWRERLPFPHKQERRNLRASPLLGALQGHLSDWTPKPPDAASLHLPTPHSLSFFFLCTLLLWINFPGDPGITTRPIFYPRISAFLFSSSSSSAGVPEREVALATSCPSIPSRSACGKSFCRFRRFRSQNATLVMSLVSLFYPFLRACLPAQRLRGLVLAE